MKTEMECMPCLIKQALNVISLSKCKADMGERVIREVLARLSKINFDLDPAFSANIVYHTFKKVTGIKDPFAGLKKKYNKFAFELYPGLEEILETSTDSLYTAVKIAIAGNIIDFGLDFKKGDRIDLETIMHDIKNKPLARDDYKDFKKAVGKAANILYITDNAGEIIFDRILIEQLIKQHKNVVVSVKSGPIINDATIEDAREAGLDRLVKIIETGSSKIGIQLESAPENFLYEFNRADLIISKGQGNIESLYGEDANIYFLLKVKCLKVARELGVGFGDIVFTGSKSPKA